MNRRVLRMAVVGLCMFVAHTTHAQFRPGFEMLDRVVDLEILQHMTTELACSEAQQAAIESLWSDYFSDIVALDARMEADSNAALREKQAHRTNGESLTRADIDAPLAVYRKGLREGDARYERFISDISALLSEAQLEQMPALRQYIERRNVLAPYPVEASITPLRRIVDVLELLPHAMQADQPLHGLDALPEHAETLDTLRQMHRSEKVPQIQSVLRRRRGMDERAYDDPNRGARWYRFIETDLRFVNGVRDLARVALDASAARAWERMYWTAIAPQLGALLQLEGAAPWIAEHIPDAGTRAPLEAFVATYRRDHHRALRRAITLGIQATRRHGVCWGSEPEQQAFVDALVEVNALHAERLELFVTRLPDDALREQFQSAIFRGVREHLTQPRIAIPDALLR